MEDGYMAAVLDTPMGLITYTDEIIAKIDARDMTLVTSPPSARPRTQ